MDAQSCHVAPAGLREAEQGEEGEEEEERTQSLSPTSLHQPPVGGGAADEQEDAEENQGQADAHDGACRRAGGMRLRVLAWGEDGCHRPVYPRRRPMPGARAPTALPGGLQGAPVKLSPPLAPGSHPLPVPRAFNTWEAQLPASAGDAWHQAALPATPTLPRDLSPAWPLTDDSGPGAGLGGPEGGGAEVQDGDPAADTRRGGIPDLGAGGEVPTPQLLAQLPAPLGSLLLVVTQRLPPPLVKDLDVPFARRGAGHQPPQGLGLGAWGREAEGGVRPTGRRHGWLTGLSIPPACGPSSPGTSSWLRDAHGISASPRATGTGGCVGAAPGPRVEEL